MKVSELLVVCVLLLGNAALLRADAPATQPARLPTTTVVHDLDGREVAPLAVGVGRRAVVLVFIATDCPISNGYAPTVADLWRAFGTRGIDFFVVYVDPALAPADAKAHHDAYGFPCDALLDPDLRLAHAVGATVTPEAVVVGPAGALLYRGRIDDQYASVGRKRFAATTHELRDVLAQVAGDQPVTVRAMPAVGCAIP